MITLTQEEVCDAIQAAARRKSKGQAVMGRIAFYGKEQGDSGLLVVNSATVDDVSMHLLAPRWPKDALTVEGLRKQLDAWEKDHNADPNNAIYLGEFRHMPIVAMHYAEEIIVTKGSSAIVGIAKLYRPAGLGPVELLNNPRCLGIEVWEKR